MARIIVNPKVFDDERDALCVAYNEAFRIVMEETGFDPVSEPTDEQRKFFSDTAYADDEMQLRRTIIARICTFDTSVENPTDEQVQEAVEFLESVLEGGFPKTRQEQATVQKIKDILSAVPMKGEARRMSYPEEDPSAQVPEEHADMYGGSSSEDERDLTTRAGGRIESGDADAGGPGVARTADVSPDDARLREADRNEEALRMASGPGLGNPEADAKGPVFMTGDWRRKDVS